MPKKLMIKGKSMNKPVYFTTSTIGKCMDPLTLGDLIAKGADGAVHKACMNNKCNEYVVKVQTATPAALLEVSLHQFLDSLRNLTKHGPIAPGIKKVCQVDDKIVIVMEKMGVVDNELIPKVTKKQLGRFIDRILFLNSELNLVHNDIKPNNIFITSHGELVPGDFGRSFIGGSRRKYEPLLLGMLRKNDIPLPMSYHDYVIRANPRIDKKFLAEQLVDEKGKTWKDYKQDHVFELLSSVKLLAKKKGNLI